MTPFEYQPIRPEKGLPLEYHHQQLHHQHIIKKELSALYVTDYTRIAQAETLCTYLNIPRSSSGGG